MSISLFMRAIDMAAAGLAERRSYRAIHSRKAPSLARLGRQNPKCLRCPGAIDILQHGLKLLICRTPGRQLIHWRE